MEIKDLVRILKGVPRANLRLFALTRKLVGESGTIDPDKVAFHYKELKEATDEARAYSESTQEAVRCLKQMDQS